MNSDEVFYRFDFAGGRRVALKVAPELTLSEPPPEWTRLSFAKCRNCPLNNAEVEHCPYALRLIEPLRLLGGDDSFTEVTVKVLHHGRGMVVNTTLQRALGSLMGLLGGYSGCPHTAPLKPMAFFHLPLASLEETLFRAAGSVLLGQYLRGRKGLAAQHDLTLLIDTMHALREVNRGLAERLRGAASHDAPANALVLLAVQAAEMEYSLDTFDTALAPFFSSYFKP
ncbi:DUF6901 family protein [Atopomonas sediminilitoris]|uniref:DUF6901 family protein n=1 Tax=Atopomonas sediminilitoris TaxID=2919919 RepID=UPI001F4D57DF|nr:hypothetical protein [Atopomonas sediminilitoris]MCJ8168665.1 hypothetical protein [Atopomonas sediminilitoris]